jgi:hypothetical protein
MRVCVCVCVYMCVSVCVCTCVRVCVCDMGRSQGTVRAIAFSATAQTLAIASSMQHPVQSSMSLFRVQAQETCPAIQQVLAFEPFENDGIQHVFFVGGSDSVILTVNSNRTQYGV